MVDYFTPFLGDTGQIQGRNGQIYRDDDGAFGGDGDDWDSQAEALFHSESNIEENEE